MTFYFLYGSELKLCIIKWKFHLPTTETSYPFLSIYRLVENEIQWLVYNGTLLEAVEIYNIPKDILFLPHCFLSFLQYILFYAHYIVKGFIPWK